MACDFPQVNESSEQIKEILEKFENIAIIGLSPSSEKDSNRVAKYLQEKGYRIFPVYPKEETILGERVYRTLEEIDERVDIVNVFRKAEVLDEVVDISIQRGDVKVVWSQIGIVNDSAAKRAKDAGISAVQNRCTMQEHKRYFG